MAKRKRINRLISSKVDKYALGDFVTQNAEVAEQYQSQINNLPQAQNNTMGTALSTAGLGATVGTAAGSVLGGAAAGSVVPGIGTLIGAGIGLIGGLIGGKSAYEKAKDARKVAINNLNTQRSNITKDLYEGAIDTNNENPYGVYASGGDIISDIPINIEKGELQIDPDSGDILRKFIGINPESGGLYEDHKSKGKDSINNFVTAKEGTFIITKAKAGDYEKAIDNNDTIHQNTILQNIRNKKRKLGLTKNKFADGGDILNWRLNPFAVSTQQNPIYANGDILNTYGGGVNPNLNISIPSKLTNNISSANIPVSKVKSNSNIGDIANGVLGMGTGIYNIVQGLRAPNYQDFTPVRLDIENRREILENLPEEISVNPALNNIRNSRNRAYNQINATSSSPTIARANKLGLESTFLDAENQALYGTQMTNNQIKSQRASILSGLSQQDMARTAGNVANMMKVEELNRQLDLAKEQQMNTGVSQIVQNIRNNQANRDQKRNDLLRIRMLRDMNPYIGSYMDQWEKYLK